MNENDLLSDSVGRVYHEHADLQERSNQPSKNWKNGLISGLSELGLQLAMTPEENGGYGLNLSELTESISLGGEYASDMPVGETVLANWLLSTAGLPQSRQWLTFGPTTSSDELHFNGTTVTGVLQRFPMHDACADTVLIAQMDGKQWVTLVELKHVETEQLESLSDERLARVTLSKNAVIASAPAPEYFSSYTPILLGATIRNLQMVGALNKILELTLNYIRERQAFGRSLSRFQVVQHEAARLAEEAAIAESAAVSAIDAMSHWIDASLSFDDPELILEVVGAKIRISDAVTRACAIAHQLHGAIGFTSEYMLSHLTLTAMNWRDDFDSESRLSHRLGELILDHGTANLWPLLAAR